MEENNNKKSEEIKVNDEDKDSILIDENIDNVFESEELEKLIEENCSLRNSLAIIQADFINFKNRTEKEKAQSILLANESLINKLLPIVDDLERALEHTENNNEFTKGIEIILNNFREILKKEGLEEIESDNIKFDHTVHQAILLEKDDSVDSGYVIDTLLKGYKLNNKILRPSMVKVSE